MWDGNGTDWSETEEEEGLSLPPKRDPLYIVIPVFTIYLTILLSGLVGNISTCLVIARHRHMRTPTNYYLFSLALSDLLLLLTGLPQEMYYLWSNYPYVFGEVFCLLRGLAAETSANATVLTITAFTVERYVAVCRPFLSQSGSGLTRALRSVLFIWLISLIFALPLALQFGVVGPVESAACSVKRVLLDHSFEISSLLFFVLPMCLISLLYILIWLALRRASRPRSSSTRLLKMLVAVVVGFFICWAPFHLQRLLYVYGYSSSPQSAGLYSTVTYISGMLYYLSTTINPILYHIMSVKFRNAFKETWCGGGSWRYLILSQGAGGGWVGGKTAIQGGGPPQRSATESAGAPSSGSGGGGGKSRGSHSGRRPGGGEYYGPGFCKDQQDISNSSLRAVESGDIHAELIGYINDSDAPVLISP